MPDFRMFNGLEAGDVVVVTGASSGIGLAVVKKFVYLGFEVHGIDRKMEHFDDSCRLCSGKYYHHQADVRYAEQLPDINGVKILVNCAGEQNSDDDIATNLRGTINCTEKYAHPGIIRAVVNMASVSAHNGAEFPEYCASKGGVLSYTIATAKALAPFSATCNSLSFGGVLTDLNRQVIDDRKKWDEIMSMTPMKKWATADECADWVCFISCVNQSMTGQDIIIDNGEMVNHRFVW